MSHETIVTVFVILGALICAACGWIVAKIAMEEDNFGGSLLIRVLCTFAITAAVHAFGIHRFGWDFCIFAVLPAYWIMGKVLVSLDQLPPDPHRSQSGSEVGQSFFKGLLTVFCLLAGGLAAGLVTHHYGFVFGLAVATIGNVVIAPTVLGGLFSLIFILMALFEIWLPWVGRRLDGVADRVVATVGRRS